MESATAAVAMPPAEVHAFPTSDGTEVRLTRYKFGTKGPIVLAPGLRQRRARVRDRHRAQELGPVPGRARLRRVAVRLPRQPGSAVELHAVHGRRHRACATGRRRSTPSAERPARTPCRRWATASAGSRCSWRSAAGWRACAAPRSRSLAGHPIPTPGNQARAWARMATLLKTLGVKRLDVEYDPKRWDGKAGRDGDEARSRSGTSTTTRSRAASTSSTATSTTTRTSTSRRWSRPCRASSAAAT